ELRCTSNTECPVVCQDRMVRGISVRGMFAIPLTLIPLSPCPAARLENLRGTRRSWEIALHAFSETSRGKSGFAIGRQPAGFIRCDQHVGLDRKSTRLNSSH